eukprot:scaffold546167_cov22-Prasinocladus_malaysianus.AAC.1
MGVCQARFFDHLYRFFSSDNFHRRIYSIHRHLPKAVVAHPLGVALCGAPIRLRATRVTPGPLARLGPGSELIVAPQLRVRPDNPASDEKPAGQQPQGPPLWVRAQASSGGDVGSIQWTAKDGKLRSGQTALT